MLKPKFKIGDLVFFSATKGFMRKVIDGLGLKKQSYSYKEEPLKPQPFSVTDRTVEECYGGSQIHYTLRPLQIDGTIMPFATIHKELIKCREMELEKYHK